MKPVAPLIITPVRGGVARVGLKLSGDKLNEDYITQIEGDPNNGSRTISIKRILPVPRPGFQYMTLADTYTGASTNVQMTHTTIKTTFIPY